MSQRWFFCGAKRNDPEQPPHSIQVSVRHTHTCIRVKKSRLARPGTEQTWASGNDENGFIIFGASFILFLAMATVGLLELRSKSAKNIERQIELDRCIGKTALTMKAFYPTLEASVKRIQTAERAAHLICLSSPLHWPQALQVLERYTQTEKMLQTVLERSWQVMAWSWNEKKTCRFKIDDKVPPFPAFPLNIEDQTLNSKTQSIWVQSGPIYSCAKIETKNKNRYARWALESELGCHS